MVAGGEIFGGRVTTPTCLFVCLTTLDRASSVVCNSLVQKSKMRILVLLASIGAVLCQEEHEEHHHEQSIPAANDDLHRKLQGSPNMLVMQEEVPDTFYKARDMFGDLGKGLRLLLRSPSISSKHLSSLITALFDRMHLDNQAACLLFSCEAVVKLFLTNLVRRAGGFFVLSQMLVAMIAVCGRLGNQLSQGLSKIVEWSFTLLEGLERKKMIYEFWKEVGEGLEEGDIDEDILIELGVLVGARAFSAGIGCESVKDLREEAFHC